MQQEVSCPNCGARIIEGQDFCGACGASFSKNAPLSVSTCPGCGSQISSGQRYCGVCGTQLAGTTQPQAKATQPVSTAVPQVKAAETAKAPEEEKAAKVRPAPQQKTSVEGYGMLNFATGVFRVIGWIILIGGCLGAIAIIVFALLGGGLQPLIPGMGTLTGQVAIFVGIGCLVLAFIYGVAFIAFGELCHAVARIAAQVTGKK
jgi:DNA-directed RNA polymerase subunit RPC12/RpoP